MVRAMTLAPTVVNFAVAKMTTIESPARNITTQVKLMQARTIPLAKAAAHVHVYTHTHPHTHTHHTHMPTTTTTSYRASTRLADKDSQQQVLAQQEWMRRLS